MPVARHEHLAWTAGYCGAYVGVGLAAAVLGPTLPRLAEHTHSQLSQISFLFTGMSLGYLIGSLLGGRLYDRVPGHPVMAAGLAAMAAALAVAPAIPYLWLLVGVVLILGMVTGAVDVGGNVLLVWIYSRRLGPYMNALHFFFGVGSFLSPVIVAQAVTLSGDVAWAYRALALLMLPAALWLLRLPSPTARNGTADDPAQHHQPRSHERLLLVLFVLLFFLYVGAEASFGGWIYTYAVGLGLSDEATAAYLTSAFWGALTLGRLLGVPIATRFRPRSVLLVDLVGCLASVGVLLLWPGSRAATWVGTCGLGFSMASIFPTLIALAERRLTITGQITGWFLAGSSVGGMFLPWLIGQLFESSGPQSTMVIILVDLVLAVGVFAALMSRATRELSLPERLVYNGDER